MYVSPITGLYRIFYAVAVTADNGQMNIKFICLLIHIMQIQI